MTNRLREAFARARSQRRPALVAYVMAGDPSYEVTRALVPRLVEAGADVIELGVPFSDPIADGPVLQAAALRAIGSRMTLERTIGLADELKAAAPIVLMGYCNPIHSMGESLFAASCGAAGVAGAIVPDLPLDEAVSFTDKLRQRGVSFVPLVAPTTPPARIQRITSLADGFIYYVSVAGVTGARSSLPEDLGARVAAAKKEIGDLPLAIGFGVSTPALAKEVGALADGVVVGSAIVRALQEGGPDAAVELVRSIRAALEAAGS